MASLLRGHKDIFPHLKFIFNNKCIHLSQYYFSSSSDKLTQDTDKQLTDSVAAVSWKDTDKQLTDSVAAVSWKRAVFIRKNIPVDNIITNYQLNISSYSIDNSETTKQLLTVLCHSFVPKPSVLITLLSEYVYAKHTLATDIITYKDLFKQLQSLMLVCISTMTNSELEEIIIILRELKSLKLGFIRKAISSVAHECKQRCLVATTLQQSLSYFNLSFSLLLENIVKDKNYDLYIDCFQKNIDSATYTEALQVLLFASQKHPDKFNSDVSDILIKIVQQNYEKLTLDEVGIAFMSSVLLKKDIYTTSQSLNDLSDKLIIELNRNTLFTDLDWFAIDNILYMLSHKHFKSKKLISAFSAWICKVDHSSIPLETLSVITTFIVLNKFYDKQLFNKFEEIFNVQSDDSLIKIKTIAKLLWSFSLVGHECEDKFINKITYCSNIALNRSESLTLITSNKTMSIKQKTSIENNKLKFMRKLCDICYSLSIMNIYPESLISHVFKQSGQLHYSGYSEQNFHKMLYFLSECVRLEAPHLLPQEFQPNYSNTTPDLNEFEGSHKLNEVLDLLNEQIGSKSFTLECPIPFIHLCSIVFRFPSHDECQNRFPTEEGKIILGKLQPVEKKNVSIEVLCLDTKLDNCNLPIGKIKLKQRLLKSKGWQVRTVSNDDISAFNDSKEISNFLIDTIVKK